MASFLPRPQEFAYRRETLAPSDTLVGFISPWTEEDATLDVLESALTAFLDHRPVVTPATLPGRPGCSFALAKDADTAAALVQQAVAQWARPVPTLDVCLDGGNMREPTDGMGKPEAPEGGLDGRAESYTLLIRPSGIAIAATDRAGLYYGAQTLAQALDGVQEAAPGLDIRDFPSQAWRGIQFDMKYDFYRVETLHEQLRMMGTLKLNRALFEYEDKFPYRRHPVIVNKKLALTLDQIAELRRTAARHHIRIVPLVQTLGHLEFALKHPSLAALREVPDGHTMMCPQKPAAQQFVRDLIDEVLAAHPDADALHIGADETALLGYCPACKAFAAEHGTVRIWVDHYKALAQYVLDKGVRPILWDDIVRRDATQAMHLPKGLIFTYWIYETVRDRHGERPIPAALESFYGCAGKRPAERPDTLSTYPHYDYYRQLGFDIVAVPCYNVGTLVPCFEITTRNTATWAEKTNLCGGLGMINSFWASFLMHPDAGWYGVAQTADVSWWWPSINRLDLDARFGERFFGVHAPDAAECLAAVSLGVGTPSRLKRPLSLLTFAYMENVIHFEGNMEMRQKRGGSLNAGFNVHNHLRRKLELLEEAGYEGEVRRQLDDAEPILLSAARRLKAFRRLARRNTAFLDLYACYAELKAHRCRLWRFLLDVFAARSAPPGADAREQAAAFLKQEQAFRRRFYRFHHAKLCTADAKEVTRLHFEGESRLLADLAAGHAIPPSTRTAFAGQADRAEDVKDF